MSKWIPVLVRAEDVEDVTRLILEREAARNQDDIDSVIEVLQDQGTSRSDQADASKDDSRQSWSVEDLGRLAKGDTATTERWARALDVCAKEPENYLPTTVIAERSGMTVAEWRDAPRKISRHLKAHYPNVPKDENGDACWPLHAWSKPEYPGQVSWAITAEMARLWNQVRA